MNEFEPKSEQEIDAMMVWPAGEYDFEVEGAKHKTSKSSGKPMIELTLRVFDEEGRSQLLTDWLVASNQPLPLRKLRHYCSATDSMDAYESGTLDNFLGEGAAGRLKLYIEKDPQYGDKNKVADYVKRADERPELQGVPAEQTRRAMATSNQIDDPEIPFSLLIAIIGSMFSMMA